MQDTINCESDSEATPLKPGGDVTRIKMRLQSRFNRLVEAMDPDYGLLDELLSTDVISMKQYRDVINRTTDRNWHILRSLIDEKSDADCHQFLHALRSTDQQHVVNLILSDCTGKTGEAIVGYTNTIHT